MRKLRVLIAEDDDALRGLLLESCERHGMEVIELEDGFELADYVDLLIANRLPAPDVLLTDVRMPGQSGLDVLRKARASGLRCPVIVLTAFPEQSVLDEATALGARVLGKPADLDEIRAAITAVAGNPTSRTG